MSQPRSECHHRGQRDVVSAPNALVLHKSYARVRATNPTNEELRELSKQSILHTFWVFYCHSRKGEFLRRALSPNLQRILSRILFQFPEQVTQEFWHPLLSLRADASRWSQEFPDAKFATRASTRPLEILEIARYKVCGSWVKCLSRSYREN